MYTYIGLFGTGKCRFIQVLYLGRAPRTKETLSNFREKCRVTRHSRVFRGLTGSQRTLGFWGVTLRVDPGFVGFDKLLEVGVSPYLGFILCLRAMLMFELNEVVRSRLIGPKYWDQIVMIFEPFTIHGLCTWTVWAVCVMIYALIHVVMCVRPGSTEKYGFIK